MQEETDSPRKYQLELTEDELRTLTNRLSWIIDAINKFGSPDINILVAMAKEYVKANPIMANNALETLGAICSVFIEIEKGHPDFLSIYEKADNL
jgi:hypothetical protein